MGAALSGEVDVNNIEARGYEEFTRLAETRLAQDTLNFINVYEITFKSRIVQGMLS